MHSKISSSSSEQDLEPSLQMVPLNHLYLLLGLRQRSKGGVAHIKPTIETTSFLSLMRKGFPNSTEDLPRTHLPGF